MEWKDPDTGEKVYQAENNATFQPGDVRKVNLKVPENRGTNAEVYVMNKYSRELEVFLDINESYQGSKIIPPGSYMRHFGTYPVPQGKVLSASSGRIPIPVKPSGLSPIRPSGRRSHSHPLPDPQI